MGFSVSIAGGIIMFTMIYSIITFTSLIGTTSTQEGASSKASFLLENSILKSDIRIVSMNALPSSNVITFTLTNNGTEKLWNYDKFSVIITYDGDINSTSRYVEQLSYVPTCASQPVGTWCIVQFINDLQDPSMLNAGGGVKIICMVQHALHPVNSQVTILASTDNGVVATRSQIF